MATCSSESAFFVASPACFRSLRKAPFIFSICFESSVSFFFSLGAAGAAGAAAAGGASSAANTAEPRRSVDRTRDRRRIDFMEGNGETEDERKGLLEARQGITCPL